MADNRNDNFRIEGENVYDKKRRRLSRANLVLLFIACVLVVLVVLFSCIFAGEYGFRYGSSNYDRSIYYSEGLYFTQNSSRSYAVTGVDDEYADEIEIPSSYNGLPVTAISGYAFENSSVKTVSIPSSVTDINNGAFSYCSSLEAVYIPRSTSYVGYNAFYGCYNLLIFAGASSLPSGWSSTWNPEGCDVYWNFAGLPTDNVTYTLITDGGESDESISARWLTTLPTAKKENCVLYGWYTNHNFSSESRISAPYYSAANVTLYARWIDTTVQSEGLRIEDDVITGIGTCTDSILVLNMPVADGTFAGNDQITDVFLRDVSSIGGSAFRDCLSLKSITLIDDALTIGSDAFYNCNAVTEIRFNVTNMGNLSYNNKVFSYVGTGGNNLTVTIGANVASIPSYLFCDSCLTAVIFEDESQCSKIGSYAFEYCSYLTSITIPENITTIGDYAFSSCTGLMTIYYNATNANSSSSSSCIFYDAGRQGKNLFVSIGSNVEYIPSYLFYYSYIADILFEEGSVCEGIGRYAFRNCSIIKIIDIPDNMTYIDEYAFMDCSKLESVAIGKNMERIEYSAFIGCSSLSMVYYAGTAEEWDEILIGNLNYNLTNAAIYYYSESPVYDGSHWRYVDGEPEVWS